MNTLSPDQLTWLATVPWVTLVATVALIAWLLGSEAKHWIERIYDGRRRVIDAETQRLLAAAKLEQERAASVSKEAEK